MDGRRDRPPGQRETVNFGVVTHVDRKIRMKEKLPDYRRVRILPGQRVQRTSQCCQLAGRHSNDRLNDERGFLLAAPAQSDQGASGDLGMAAKNLFDRFGVKWAARRFHAFGNSSAEP